MEAGVNTLEIRDYLPQDCECLAKLFYDTVHTVNAQDYTEEQLNAWANGKVDLEKWHQSLCNHHSAASITAQALF